MTFIKASARKSLRATNGGSANDGLSPVEIEPARPRVPDRRYPDIGDLDTVLLELRLAVVHSPPNDPLCQW